MRRRLSNLTKLDYALRAWGILIFVALIAPIIYSIVAGEEFYGRDLWIIFMCVVWVVGYLLIRVIVWPVPLMLQLPSWLWRDYHGMR